MIADLSTYMAEDLLVKVDRTLDGPLLGMSVTPVGYGLDRMGGGASVVYEVRANRFGWPSPNGGKWLVREAVRDRLPPGFLDRPKQGFSVPLEYRFRGGLREIVEDRVLHGPLNNLKLFRLSGLERTRRRSFQRTGELSFSRVGPSGAGHLVRPAFIGLGRACIRKRVAKSIMPWCTPISRSG